MTEPMLSLRAIEARDLDCFFAHQRDPVARQMAAFTSADPDDRAGVDAHWVCVMVDPGIVNRTIESGGAIVGHVASFARGYRGGLAPAGSLTMPGRALPQ